MAIKLGTIFGLKIFQNE